MGNLFMGFPVPRAKIAEMIEGTAPPSIHIVNHLPGGSDELVLSADISSGQLIKWDGSKFIGLDEPSAGAPFPWDGINIGSIFEAIDGYNTWHGGTSTVIVNLEGLRLYNPEASISNCACYRLMNYISPASSWGKATRFDAQVEFDVWKDANPTVTLIKGQKGNYNKIGFFADNNGLFGITGNATGNNTEQIASHGATKFYVDALLSARFTPGVKCEFYLNGTLEGTSTTKLPTGSGALTYAFYADLTTSGDAKPNYFKVNYWNTYQSL